MSSIIYHAIATVFRSRHQLALENLTVSSFTMTTVSSVSMGSALPRRKIIGDAATDVTEIDG
jgi:hypothetical protein